MNSLEKLIGAQITRIDENSIEVNLNGSLHRLELNSDYGDCCGYAEFKTQMLYSENDLRNPVITNVELKNSEEDDYGSSEITILTFYGESKELATVESEAGSGSGWNYGATVSIRCDALEINEDLASW